MQIIYGSENYNLTIQIDNLKNNNGEILISLFNDPSKFPDESLTKYYKQISIKIEDKKVKYTFENLPKDRYVVSILHDENINKKIDKGFILPNEGIGVSNYKKINLFNRPNFNGANFILDRNKHIEIDINYF
jgi:uncharacterized protein (DUF2141 family)